MPELPRPKRPATHYLRRFYYDCIIESPEILTNLIRLVGADRMLFGTDYPSPTARLEPDRVHTVEASANCRRADRDLILGGNAARLFKL